MSDTKPSILIQLDSDPQPSVFDGVVAVDSGVSHLFRHGGVTPGQVRDLIYGAMFTRGPADLKSTAVFIGGSNVQAGESLLESVKSTFFGPFRVSVLFDSNGANTTAAAAVLAAVDGFGGSVDGVEIALLAGTGPVGRRVARLLAGLGAKVSLGSRKLDRAREAASEITSKGGKPVQAFETSDENALIQGVSQAQAIITSGTTGVTLLSRSARSRLADLKVLIDLNAVPPLGIEGVESNDRKTSRDGLLCWGALGVGATKMKIHKAALKAIFEKNDRVLDAEEVLALGRSLA